jgi:hypothetical protein
MRSAETPAATAGALRRGRARAKLDPFFIAATWLYARPRTVLAGLVAVQWLAILAFALTVRHNGWVYYQGGDQIWYTTTASLIGDAVLPPTYIGFGWVIPLVPLSWLLGPEYTGFLPPAIGLNVLVLGPVALACVYAIAVRIGGRLLGLYAALFWVAAPFLAIPFFRYDYHDRYVEQFLPQALGLTAMADFPSMVCLLVAAWLLVRALDAVDWTWAALAGLAAGVGATIKPSNLLFLAGPALLLLLSRRWRVVLPYVAGTVPPLLLLALWKQRGLGTVPAFALEQTRVAAGAVVSASVLDKYVYLDWDTFRHNMASLREYAYSVRVLQWIPIAGAFAVARRSLPLGGLLAGWFGAFLLVKGTAPQATVDSGSLFRLLMPAFPAYFLLFASLPLLLPGVLRRIKAGSLLHSTRPIARRTLVVVGVFFVGVPLIAIAAPQPIDADKPEAISINTILTPVDQAIRVSITPDGARRTVTWTHPDFGSTDVFYKVYRTEFRGEDVDCGTTRSPECVLKMIELKTTREARYVDLSPPEDARYRIGIATNWQNDPTGGDVVSISAPIAATP